MTGPGTVWRAPAGCWALPDGTRPDRQLELAQTGEATTPDEDGWVTVAGWRDDPGHLARVPGPVRVLEALATREPGLMRPPPPLHRQTGY